MNVEICEERADSADAQQLITELDEVLGSQYPVESRHGYSVEKLLNQGVIFYVVRCDGAAAACGGVQFFNLEYGELKRMYVRPGFRGMGLARRMISEIEGLARGRGVNLLRLETGIHQVDAIHLYESCGFTRIGPFGAYFEDPLSRCYEKQLVLSK